MLKLATGPALDLAFRTSNGDHGTVTSVKMLKDEQTCLQYFPPPKIMSLFQWKYIYPSTHWFSSTYPTHLDPISKEEASHPLEKLS